MVEAARLRAPIPAAMASSPGSSTPASSQPWACATLISSVSLSRPSRPLGATSRAVSPARSRTSTCRNWNISILLRPTALPCEQKARTVAVGWLKTRDALSAAVTGRQTPILPDAAYRLRWPVYADPRLAGLCRSLTSGNLLSELAPDEALDLWFPLFRVAMVDQEDAMDAEETFAAPCEGRVIIAWPDGTLHIGVPPRTQEDISALYRHARIVLEHVRAGSPSVVEHRELDAALH